MSIKFSVNIPLYNGEKYIGRCIESVLNQSYENFEINIVDDGSTDGSYEAVRKYDDKRINYYRKENEGPLLARVLAVEKSHGEYCVFIDCDDYVVPEYLEKINETTEKENCDMVACLFKESCLEEEKNVASLWDEVKIFEGKETDEFCMKFLLNSSMGPMWTKIIKTELLKSDSTDFRRYKMLRNGEDFLQSIYPVFHARKIVFLPYCFYNYCANPTSATHSIRPERFRDILILRKISYDLLKKSASYSEENEREFFNSFMKTIINCVKEIAACDKAFKEKKELLEAIASDEIYKKASASFDKKSLGKMNETVYDLFEKRMYGIMSFSVSGFVSLRRK